MIIFFEFVHYFCSDIHENESHYKSICLNNCLTTVQLISNLMLVSTELQMNCFTLLKLACLISLLACLISLLACLIT